MRNAIMAPLGAFTLFIAGLGVGCAGGDAGTKAASSAPAAAAPPMASPILEVAIRKVKAGQEETFKARRAAFIKLLKEAGQGAILADREFESFYSLTSPKEKVFIGMTLYRSAADAMAVGKKVMGTQTQQAFFQTVDFECYQMVKAMGDGAFDLAAVPARDGQVVEVAVREVEAAKKDAFEEQVNAFLPMLRKQDGVVSDFNFVSITDKKPTEKYTTVGMTVYESAAKANGVAQSLVGSEAFKRFLGTFRLKCQHLANRTTNQ